MKRNLVYYVFPLRSSIWRWNVELMRSFLPHFNGRKLFIVAKNSQTEDADEVIRAIDCPEGEPVVVENDPELWETRHFIPALEKLQSVDENESTFYAHAKGVTRDLQRESGVLGWIRALWLLNLGCVDLVDSLLTRYPTVGAFRWSYTHTKPLSSGRFSPWQYSGAFFWLKHSKLFSNNWKEIIEDPYGIECYPGIQFSIEDSFDLSGGRWRDHNLYFDAPGVEICEEWLEALVTERLKGVA